MCVINLPSVFFVNQSWLFLLVSQQIEYEFLDSESKISSSYSWSPQYGRLTG